MLAITNARLYPITQAPIEKGILLIQDGKVVGIGANLEIPVGAQVFDVQGAVVMPGFVDAHTHVGLWGEAEGPSSYDGNEGSAAITPQVRGIDAINPAHHSFADARQAGITTLQTGPGSGNPIGGELLVVKTAGRIADKMVVRAPSGLKAALGENPKRFHGQAQKRMPSTRMGTAALIRENLIKAREYVRKQEAAKDHPEKMPESNLALESIAKVLRGEIPMRIHAHRADDIVTAVRIAKEFNIRISIEHCTEGHLITDFLSAHDFPACVGPTLSHRSKVETANLTFETVGTLQKAGVKVAIISDHPFVPIPFYNILGALAVRHGASEEETLRSMTITPAEILGVADRVGSLEVGKDADFVIWSGHPFKTRSRVLATYIEGQPVYEA